MDGLFYELSQEADTDLDGIFDYTESEYGLEQAVSYLTGFEALFEGLLDNPKLGRERREIRTDLRSIGKDSHVVFYRVLKDRIRIVRILHGSRDLPKFLT